MGWVSFKFIAMKFFELTGLSEFLTLQQNKMKCTSQGFVVLVMYQFIKYSVKLIVYLDLGSQF